MSGYQQYSGNPYGQAEQGYGGPGNANPYGGTVNANPYGGTVNANPYGGTTGDHNNEALNPPPPLQQQESNYSQGSQYSTPAPAPTHAANPLSQQDFLARIDGTKSRINQLSANIQEIATIHQRTLSSPDSRSSAQLESIVSETQVRNTQIKDEIKFLEKDASREPSNKFKRTQVESLKRTFRDQLNEFQREEADYSKRYREAIGRQYRIVNPDATEEEVQQAQNADWGDEGIFQQALKSNRSGQATSVLGAVRARHNDIQRIERTIGELALLFQQLDEAVVYAEEPVKNIDDGAGRVLEDTGKVNEQLDIANKHARNRRKLKWWTLFVVVAIIAILALVLGLYFGLQNNNDNNNNNSNNNNGQ